MYRKKLITTRLFIFSAKLFALILLLLPICRSPLWASPTYSSERDLRFKKIDLSSLERMQGSLGPINSILQDSYGFIWISSEQGLVRFDGHDFRVYTAGEQESKENVGGRYTQNIAGNVINDLALDLNGTVWIGTTSGLSQYQSGSDNFKTYRSSSDLEKGLPNSNVTSIAVDKDNRILIGTPEGFSIYDQKLDRFIPVKLALDGVSSKDLQGINDVHFDPRVVNKNICWLSTHHGVIELDLTTLKISDHLLSDTKIFVKSSLSDIYGNLWMGTFGNGLIKKNSSGEISVFTHETLNDRSLGSDTVRHIYEDSNHNLWLAMDHGGLNLFDYKTKDFTRYVHRFGDQKSLSSNQTRYVFEDREKNLWVGTYFGGINVVDSPNSAISTITRLPGVDSLNHNAILSVYQTKDNHIWVGSEGGLNEFDQNNNVIASYKSTKDDNHSLRANPVLAITESDDNGLWLGTWSGGLNYFDRQTKKFTHYFPSNEINNSLNSPYVWSLLLQNSNTLWVGTETGGLNRFDIATQEFTHFKNLSSDEISNDEPSFTGLITGLIKDREGNIWVSSLSGVYFLDVTSMEFTSYKKEGVNENRMLSSDRAVSIIEHSSGDIWVGTQDNGINIIHRNDNTITQLTSGSDLPSLNVTSLVEDNKNNIWAATLNGIVKIDLSDNFRTYVLKKQHGIAGNQFNRDASLKNQNGLLYFGGLSGLTIIDPDAIDFSAPAREVVLTDLLVQHQEASGGKTNLPLAKAIYKSKKIKLKYNENAFSLYFSAQNYLSPKLNDYQYRLVGFDGRWVSNQNKNYANYTNLNSGKYRFEVKTTNIYGNAIGEPTSIDIIIEPAPWKSWWAYLIYFSLIALALYLIFAYYRLKIRARLYHELAITDPLTQVYNRYGFDQFVEGYFRNNEMRQGLSLLVIDFDDFNAINEQLGYEEGDAILVKAVDVMKNALRSGDHIGRWGGEQFVVLMRTTSSDASYQIADKLRRAIDIENFWNQNKRVPVTVSIGVAVCGTDESFESLFKRADEAMYNAKVSGKNQTFLG